MTNFRGFSYPSAISPAKTQCSPADGDSFTCVPKYARNPNSQRAQVTTSRRNHRV
ncbi:hypothetical protein SEA_ROHR_73 [Mycobacterium phage Rohr]|nr:hypothetical protein SEA_ROHR_73 [Mycobacterium phage Rohr]